VFVKSLDFLAVSCSLKIEIKLLNILYVKMLFWI
jgi:hypothetical protein